MIKYMYQGLLMFIMLLSISLHGYSQCTCSAAKTVTVPSSTNRTLNTGDSLCLTGTGTYSGTITMSNGGVLLICTNADVTFSKSISFSGNTSKSTIINKGKFTYSDATVSPAGSWNHARVDIYNYNTFNVTGNWQVTSTLSPTITNYAGATINVGGSLTLSGTLTNSGTLNVATTLTLNSSSSLNNTASGKITVAVLDVNASGSVNNSGKVTATQSMAFQGSGSRGVDGGVYITKNLSVSNGSFVSTSGSCGGFIVSGTSTISNNATWSGKFAVSDSTYNTGSDLNQCVGSSCPVYAAPGSASLATSCPTVLPVVFGSVTARQINASLIRVEWTTSYEKDNDYYVVQRSEDGLHFTDLGKVEGAGDSRENTNYNYLDNFSAEGMVFYRIRQVDYNGEFKTSDVFALHCSGSKGMYLDVFPNPATSEQELQMNLSGVEEEGDVIVVLMDQWGTTLFSKVYITSRHPMLIAMNPDVNLAKGIYYITASSNQGFVTQKLLLK